MKRYATVLLWFCFLCSTAQPDSRRIMSGSMWKDLNGDPINAHGGGILYFDHVYYWFGEIKKGKTTRAPDISSWEDYRVDAGGISCYSSKDLLNWTCEGLALAPEKKDSASDLHISRVIERPKVIYNERTKQFVMWMHIDRYDYGYARAGVAVSDKPAGPYRYLRSVRPNGQESRDMTLFKDDDGRAYLVYSSENNQTMQVCLLSEDYLSPTATYSRILIGANREAPAVFKYRHRYYLITSRCSGWDPNAALFATADSMMGKWAQQGNPCRGAGAEITFSGQSAYVIPVATTGNAFIFMADRWDKRDLENSRYIWLPLRMEKAKPVIRWEDAWRPDSLDRTAGNRGLPK